MSFSVGSCQGWVQNNGINIAKAALSGALAGFVVTMIRVVGPVSPVAGAVLFGTAMTIAMLCRENLEKWAIAGLVVTVGLSLSGGWGLVTVLGYKMTTSQVIATIGIAWTIYMSKEIINSF